MATTLKVLNKKNVLRWLLLINFLLVTIHLCTNHIFIFPSWTVRRWFDLNAEANIPTWFSSAQLLLLFILSVLCSRISKKKDLRFFYILMAIFFLFFSVDETSGIHEGITSISKKLSIFTFFPNSHGMWIYVYPLIFFAFLLKFHKGLSAFLNQRPGRNIFIIGAGVFVSGGIGLEILGYYFFHNESTLYYAIEVTAEESFELLGQSLMIYALLTKLELSDFYNSIIQQVASENVHDSS